MPSIPDAFVAKPQLDDAGWLTLASPGPAAPMTARVARPGTLVRAALGTLAREIEGLVTCEDVLQAFAPRVAYLGFDPLGMDPTERVAWHLIAQWLVGYGLGVLDPSSTFADAAEWFQCPIPTVRNCAPRRPFSGLGNELSARECLALTPYLLDPLSLGTRRDVLKSDAHQPSRARRKKDGIFYTPADLASFMAGRAFDRIAPRVPTMVLDPTAGSGVFLRAAQMTHPYPSNCQYFGMDLAPTAADFASYVLLQTDQSSERPSPWHCWHRHRINQATVDTLSVGLTLGTIDQLMVKRRSVARRDVALALAEGEFPSADLTVGSTTYLFEMFPELIEGADVVLTNPPYSPLGKRATDKEFAANFEVLSGTRPTTAMNIYPLMLESSLKFVSSEGALSAVVPLSLMFKTSGPIASLRNSLLNGNGHTECVSFDRTPDALFGDDVKTRNTVVTFSPSTIAKVTATGLLRWTSRNRAQFFASVRSVESPWSVEDGIAKVNSESEARFYRDLLAIHSLIGSRRSDMRQLALTDGPRSSAAQQLWIAQTAYNWINCFLDPTVMLCKGHTSQSKFNVIEFRSDEIALAAYAALSSRTALFLWRAKSDGFHVTGKFLDKFPMLTNALSTQRLAEIGQEMWAVAQDASVTSLNGGSVSVSLRPSSDLVILADECLLDGLGVHCPFDLEQWHEHSIVVDSTDTRRTRLVSKGRQ